MQPALEDGYVTVRVVGEFSSGKSKLIQEILRGAIPEVLLPRDSLERQTLLPLEITYGEKIELWEILRGSDYDKPVLLRELDHFPERAELLEDPEFLATHRLRLTLPQKNLILPFNKHQEEKKPCKVFLIDTPGWNSGEVDHSQHDVSNSDPLAVIYVVNALRLQSKENKKELEKLLNSMVEATFLEKCHLIVYVTRWDQEDNQDLKKFFEDQLQNIAKELRIQDWLQSIEYLDLKSFSTETREAFQNRFWKKLLKGIPETRKTSVDSWNQNMESWNELFSTLQEIQRYILSGSHVLHNFQMNGEYIPGFNMTRLKAYPITQWKSMLWQKWNTRLSNFHVFSSETLELQQDHPLAEWWNDCFLKAIKNGLADVYQLLMLAQETLGKITSSTENLQDFLNKDLEIPYQICRQQYLWTETLVPPSLGELIKKKQDIRPVLATLISITIAQTEIADAIKKLIPI